MLDKNLIKKRADEISEEMINWRRKIHKNPELGFKEFETSNFIAEKLKEFDIEFKRVCETGIVGLIEGEKSGKTLAIRADIDALAITEKNEVDYKSKNEGIMHACGHDGHTAILLGTAKILSEMRKDINGSVKLIFQPAEEGPGGAKPMIEKGVLKEPNVDYIIGLHLNPELKLNKIGIKKGRFMAAPDYFEITIKGKGAHGAHPEEGVDPIPIASQIVLGLQQIKSRETEALQPLVISIGSFHSGDAFNAIPEEAKMTGTVRSFEKEVSKRVKTRIQDIVKNITAAFQADYDYEYEFVYPPTYNDPQLTELMRESVIENLGRENLYEIEKPSMGGEDFAYFSQQIPGTYMRLGTRNEKKGIVHPLHSPIFNLDEEVLKQGVKLFLFGTDKILNEG